MKCIDCRGGKTYQGLGLIEPCRRCSGSGVEPCARPVQAAVNYPLPDGWIWQVSGQLAIGWWAYKHDTDTAVWFEPTLNWRLLYRCTYVMPTRFKTLQTSSA